MNASSTEQDSPRTPRPRRSRARAWLVVAVGAAVAVALGWWALSPAWTVLGTGLAAHDAREVADALERRGVAYRLSTDAAKGATIEVPAAEAREQRLSLAADGVAIGHPAGPTGSSVRETELARTIETLADVAWARVHLGSPTRGTDGPRAPVEAGEASVVVGFVEGGRLDEEEIRSVVQLLAAAVADLSPRGIRVVDEHGRLLWGGAPGADGGDARDRMGLRAELERGVNRKLSAVLDRVVGRGRYEVQSTVDVDMERVRTKETLRDPDSAVMVERERMRGAGRQEGTTLALGERESSSSTRWEYSQIESESEQPEGRIERISVAVVVDADALAGATETRGAGTTSSSPDEIARLRASLEAAAGLDARRGDVLTLSVGTLAPPAVAEPSRGVDLVAWMPAARMLAGLLAGLAILLTVVRPLVRRLGPIATPRRRDGDAEDGTAPLDSPSEAEALRRRISESCRRHPESAARALRVWLHQARGGA
jgi:flagellar M-ring protein FliF